MNKLIAFVLIFVCSPLSWSHIGMSSHLLKDDDRQQLIRVAENSLTQRLAPICQELELTIKRQPKEKRIFSESGIKLLSRIPTYPKPMKRMGVWVDQYNSDQWHKSWFIEFEVNCQSKVWLTQRIINNGEKLTQYNCAQQMMDITELVQLPVQQIEESVTRRRLNKAMVVTFQHIKTAAVITKNQPLSLAVQNGSVTLDLLAIALTEGQIGEKIWVKPIGIGKPIQAEVINNNTAVIR